MGISLCGSRDRGGDVGARPWRDFVLGWRAVLRIVSLGVSAFGCGTGSTFDEAPP